MQSTTDDSQSLAEIEEAFTSLLRVPSLVRAHNILNEKAGVSLDRPSYIALGVLFRCAPMRIADLADAVGVDHSTMSRLVNRLLASGMVEGEPDQRDRRALQLRLSDKGRELMTIATEMRSKGMRLVMSDWSPEERATFARLLTRFASGVEQFIRDAEATKVRTEP